jgi:hypothetical protein
MRVGFGVPGAAGAEADWVVADVPTNVGVIPAAESAVPTAVAVFLLTVGVAWEVETAVPDDGVPLTGATVVGTAVGEGCGVGVSVGGKGVSVRGA